MKRLRHLLCLGAFFALAACGGGGGSDDSADSVPITGTVVDTNGEGIAAVTVRLGDTTAQTDAAGRYTLQLPEDEASATDAGVMSFAKAGYMQQTRRTPDATAQAQRVDAVMQPVGASVSFDPAQAQTLTVAGSTAAVVLPANALRRDDGSAPSGQVTAELTPIDPAVNPALMPGRMGESDSEPIESFGALQVTFTDAAGEPLNLAAGQTATLRIPAVSRGTAAPATVPLYYLDESTGYWVAEGSATLTGTGADAYYEGSVSHFSTWNADQLYDTVYVNGCVRDSAGATVTSGMVTGTGVDYIGNSWALIDAEGRFTLPVKRNATTRVQAQGFDLLAYSDAQDVSVAAVDVELGSCLVIDNDGIAGAPSFPPDDGDDDDGDDTPAAFAGSYSGSFSGAESGTWSVVIAADGSLTGSGTSATSGSFGVSGSVTASGDVTLNATAGTAGLAQFSGSINAETGAVSGTWRYTGSTSDDGTFTGQRQ